MTSRRYFIGAGLSAASAVALGRAFPLENREAVGQADLAFFDPRFEGAEALAQKLAHAGARLQSITGDATDLALWFQSRAFAGVPVHLQGVTTGSIPFCLRQFVPNAEMSMRRLDRDLFVWSIRLP